MGIIKKLDGNDAESPQEISDIVMDAFFLGSITIDSVKTNDTPNISFHYSDLSQHNDVLEIFDIHKLQAAISTMGAYKAAGPDGFSPIVLKNMGSKALYCLLWSAK